MKISFLVASAAIGTGSVAVHAAKEAKQEKRDKNDVVNANVNALRGTEDKGGVADTKSYRFFDFNENPFVIADFPLLPEQTRNACPDEWVDFVACTVLECPTLVEECPLSMFYDGPSTPDLQELALDINCSTMEESFCTTFGYEGCCMAACEAQIMALTDCAVKDAGGRLRCWEAFNCAAYANQEPLEGRVCFEEKDDKFACIYTSRFEPTEDEEDDTWIDAIVSCSLNETIGFDVLNSEDCECEATLDRPSGVEQVCSCSLCSEDAEQMFSLDCRENVNDPFIVDSCPTLTCNAECIPPEIEGFLSSFKVELFADRNTINEVNETDVTDEFYPMGFVPVLDSLFFQATSKATGYELWTAESGDVGEAHLVKDINEGPQGSLDDTGSLAAESEELDGLLLFFADDGVHGKELFISDGTSNGTNLVKDIIEGSEGVSVSSFKGKSMLKWNDDLLFVLTGGDGGNAALWKTDGTTNGTVPVDDDFVLPASIRFNSLLETTSFDDNMYFVAKPRSASNSRKLFLFVSDGTVEGTKQLNDQIVEGQENLIEFNSKIYFDAGGSLWSTDGSVRGTQEVSGPDGGTFTDPKSLIVVDDSLFFWSGCQLWRTTNGNPMDYVQLFDGGTDQVCSAELTKFGSKVLFRSSNPWISDGTPAGTYRLADIVLTDATPFVVWEDQVAFFAAENTDARFGHDLWVTDGLANTHLMVGIGIDKPGLFPHIDNLFVFQNAVYLTVWYLFGPGHEIWRVKIDEEFEASEFFGGEMMISSEQEEDSTSSESPVVLDDAALEDTVALEETVAPSLMQTVSATELKTEAPTDGEEDGVTVSRTGDGNR